MNKRLLGGLTVKELTQRTWTEANKDNVFGAAAELAYYFLLALFPMLIFLTSLVAFIPGVQDAIFSALSKAMPADAMSLVRDTLRDVVQNRSGSLLSVGILGTIWAASSGVVALIGTLNRAFDASEQRTFIRLRLAAIGLTVSLSILIVGGTIFIMFGDKFIAWLAATLNLGPTVTWLWRIVDYLLGLGLIFLGLEVIYYFAPNIKQKWEWVTPGAIFAVLAAVIVSLAFSFYLRFAPNYSATYGSLGAVIVLMLWLYLIGLVILIGGEINSEVRLAKKSQNKPESPGEQRAA